MITLQNPEILALIQDNVLQREFKEALFPELLFRADVKAEMWKANEGQVAIETVSGQLEAITDPTSPRTDPTSKEQVFDQYRLQCSQYSNSVSVYMPESRASLASTFVEKTKALGRNAGQSLNRIARNKLFAPYLAGNTVTLAAASASATTLRLASMNGFIEKAYKNSLQVISATNSLIVTNARTGEEYEVIGALLDDYSKPYGSGSIILKSGIVAAVNQRDAIIAKNASYIQRPVAASSVDGIISTSVVKIDTFVDACEKLQSQDVRPHATTGFYHAHISPKTAAQLFKDADSKSLYDGRGEYDKMAINRIGNILFFMNNEVPKLSSLNQSILVSNPGGGGKAKHSNEIGAEIRNELGLEIQRDIITGDGVMYERFVPHSDFITEAGINGVVKDFSNVSANGYEVMVDRVKMIMRAPIDKLQQTVDLTWSWIGDFGVRSDETDANKPERFKRAVVVEHA